MATRFYFAFGSNMSRHRLEARVGHVEDLGRGTIADHLHRFNKVGSDGTGKGNVEPVVGHTVHGVLYRLSVAQLDTLTTYEGGYSRVRRSVVVSSIGSVGADLFIATAGAADLCPSDEYLAHYRLGIEEHGIPRDYLERILSPFGLT